MPGPFESGRANFRAGATAHNHQRRNWGHNDRRRAGLASIIANNRVVFNIKGNDYRLITGINYSFRALYIKFFGTHAEYDKVNAATVELRRK